jgi:hypothetical protein
MRVTFRAVEGSMVGKEFVVRPSQRVQVGRTDFADISFPEDGSMSSTHFEIETDLRACYIKDLGSTNGTCLNGRKIQHRQPVADGDIVVAGGTSFKVRIDGGAGSVEQRWGAAAEGDVRKTRQIVPPVPEEAPRPRPEKPPNYFAEKCDSGLTLCRGASPVDQRWAAAAAADVAVWLSEKFAAHLIVDFRKMGLSPPKELPKAEFLFDWFKPGVAEVASPLLIAQGDLAAWPDLVEAGWGKDALVCIFSNQEEGQVWSHLRRVCRAKGPIDGPPTAVLGFCWPSVLVALLSHHVAYSKQLFEGLDAILTEFPDLPDTWQVFGREALPDDLDMLGFEREKAEKAAGV